MLKNGRFCMKGITFSLLLLLFTLDHLHNLIHVQGLITFVKADNKANGKCRYADRYNNACQNQAGFWAKRAYCRGIMKSKAFKTAYSAVRAEIKMPYQLAYFIKSVLILLWLGNPASKEGREWRSA